MTQRFRKTERLSSKKTIDRLFSKNTEEVIALFSYPFKVTALKAPASSTQVLISVSKRYFKHAVDRNLIKRRIREAYRLNKENFIHVDEYPAYIAFVYVGKEILPFIDIEKKMKFVLKQLGKVS
ncbi:MAG: ribonuclease P protein component [Siphonobacter sp.]